MKIAIISAGPSARRTWRGNDGYVATIAVNRGAVIAEHDWLSAGDVQTIKWLKRNRSLPPSVGYCVTPNVVRHLPHKKRVIQWATLPVVNEHRPCTWSFTAALGLAQMLGANVVDVYGHDCTPDADVGGYIDSDRSAGRWEREARDVGIITSKVAFTVNYIRE